MPKLFGFEFFRNESSYIKKDLVANDAISFVDRDSEVSAAVVTASATFGTFIDTQGTLKTEAELITKYRDMMTQPEITAAVDEIVNEAITIDEEYVVKIDLDKLNIDNNFKQVIEQNFHEILTMLDFHSMAYYIFKRWYVDGRLYYHAVIDPDHPEEGIKEFRYVDPRKLREIKEVVPKKIPGNVSNQASDVMMTKNEYYLYNEKGFTPIAKAMTGMQGTLSSGIRISKDSIVHVSSGLTDSNSMLGLGYLHQAVKILNQLRTIEDSLIIYRLARAPERRVWYIPVGNMNKAKAEQYIRDTMTMQKNRLIYDADSGTIRDDRKFMTMLEDYWLPVRADGTSARVDTLQGGKTLGEIEDILYFQKQLYNSLNVPVDRLNSDGSPFNNNTTEVSRAEMKFNKFIARLRHQFSLLFTKSLEKQLVLKGILSIEEWKSIEKDIRYDFARDGHFTELMNAQVYQSRLNTYMLFAQAQIIGKYVSNKWIRRELFMQTEEDIEEMTMEISEEMQDPLYNQPSPEEQQQQAQQDAGQEQEQQAQQDAEQEQEQQAQQEPEKTDLEEQKLDRAKQIISAIKGIPNDKRSKGDNEKLRNVAKTLAKDNSKSTK
jgi:hypothetical protein